MNVHSKMIEENVQKLQTPTTNSLAIQIMVPKLHNNPKTIRIKNNSL